MTPTGHVYSGLSLSDKSGKTKLFLCSHWMPIDPVPDHLITPSPGELGVIFRVMQNNLLNTCWLKPPGDSGYRRWDDLLFHAKILFFVKHS